MTASQDSDRSDEGIGLDFARWLDQSDVDALGRVFDATAGRLQLLAAHLAAGSAADDLVQATFLQAMRRAATWDRARPLLPWLAAILHNEARQQWRRAERRRAVEVDDAGAEPRGRGRPGDLDADPAELVASEEAVAAVMRAIDELPPDYRQVLRLRLVHGLQPVEIARALELSAGAVRVRLHRGRERLRAALPKAIAGAVLAVLGGESLLAQVKDNVLREARALRPSPFAATAAQAAVPVAATALLMKKVLFVGIAVVIALAFAVGLSFSWGEPAGPDDPARVAAAPMPAYPAMDEQAVEREDAPAPAVMPGAPRPWTLVVAVTVGGEEPLPDADVVVELAPAGPEDLPRQVFAQGVTGPDGLLTVDLEDLRSTSFLQRATSILRITATRPGYTRQPAFVRLPGFVDDDGNTVNEVRSHVGLLPGVTIRGRVVDGRESPVVAPEVYSRRGGTAQHRSPVCSEDGTFEFTVTTRDPLLAPDGRGDAELVIVAPAHGTAVVAIPVREPDERSVDLGTITLVRGAVVRGVAVLSDGSPLAHFPIELRAMPAGVAIDGESFSAQKVEGRFGWANERLAPGSDGDGTYRYRRWIGRTAADGSFVFAGVDPTARFAVGVRDSVSDFVVMAARPDGEPIRLVVDRQLVSIEFVGARGDRLMGARLQATGWSPESSRPAEKVWPGFPTTTPRVGGAGIASSGPAGEQRMLTPFGWVWRIGPGGEVMRAEFVRHDAIRGVARTALRVDVRPEQRFGALRLVVVTASGEPIDGYRASINGLERPATRHVFVDDVAADGAHTVHDLPVGRWQVRIGVGRSIAFSVFSGGSFDENVDIYEGRTTTARIIVPAGAPLQLRLFADGPDAPPIDAVVVRDSRSGTAIEFVRGPAPASGLGPRSANGLTRAELLTRAPLPPGRNTLTIEVPGYRPAICTVDIVDGELAREMVRLQPR